MMHIEHVVLYRLYVEVKDAWTAEEWEVWENERKEERAREEQLAREQLAIIDIGMGVVAVDPRESE